MASDDEVDEVIEAYERELADPTRHRSNRRFWLVLGSVGLACVVLVVEIFANRHIGDTIAHAQHSLRAAESAANLITQRTGSLAAADADGLAAEEPDLSYVGVDQPSRGLDQVSVVASSTGWAAAVQAQPGACFYLRLDQDGYETYGVGTVCTARQALSAVDERW